MFRDFSSLVKPRSLIKFLYDMSHDLQLIRKKMVKHAKECIKQQASNSEIYGTMQAVFIEMDTAPTVSARLI